MQEEVIATSFFCLHLLREKGHRGDVEQDHDAGDSHGLPYASGAE